MALTPIFPGHVSADGRILQLADPVRGLIARHLQTLAGKPVDVIVRPHRNKRSDRASRYYFGVVVALIAEHCGYDKDELHELLAMRFLRIADDPVTGSPRRKRTPQTDSQEFADYVDACIRFGAELGVYIPEPHAVEAA